jgi:hypothetical protein
VTKLSLFVFGSLLAGLELVFLLSPIDPVAREPSPNPGLAGELEANDRLAGVERLLEGVGSGPEAVACGGALYLGNVTRTCLARYRLVR